MNKNPLSPLRRLTLLAAIGAAFSGCSMMDVKPQAVQAVNTAKKGPESAPHKSITSFSSALKCMDNLMIEYGVRDLSMLVEEIADQTKKVNAGTRDMLISAVSEMTKRSRAVRVVAFGRDAFNVVTFLQQAQRQNPYAVVPQYDIKGSITQWDENVIRNQKDLGIGYQPYVNLGASKDAAASILGLDLSVLTTRDMSILPGVTSRNSVVIYKEGKGVDGDAAYSKFGISFSMTFSKSEGQSQALRGLVELATIELMGKLTKTPYWRCLGADAQDEEVKQELADWYYAMAASQGEIIVWFQNQMRHKRFYEGPIDGRFNPAFDQAIAHYREALGLSKEDVIDQAFFFAFHAADHAKIKRPAKPFVAEVAPQASESSAQSTRPAAATNVTPANTPLGLVLTTASKRTQFAGGESIDLVVAPSQSAHLYCYLQDENASVVRFFPNRFTKNAMVPAGKALELPGTQQFRLVMNHKGVKESIACFATEQDVTKQLSANAFGGDFEALPVKDLQQVRDAFVKAAGGKLAEEILHVQPK